MEVSPDPTFSTVTLKVRRFRGFTAEGCVSITTAGRRFWHPDILHSYTFDFSNGRLMEDLYSISMFCVYSLFPFLLVFLSVVLQMNSRRSTPGCPRTTSWMCQPSSTCGHWTPPSRGAMSSWRPACAFCPGALRESSSSCSVSAKDATGSLKSTCPENGQHKPVVCVCVYEQTACISRQLVKLY